MKHKRMILIVALAVCVAAVGTVAAQSNGPNAPEVAVGTAFTYQGQIKRNGALFTGTCDLQFKLWDATSAGTQQGTMLPVNAVNVNNGVFAVQLDFGNQFKGDARWLEPAAKCADDAAFTTLPREALTPSPYAIGLMPGAVIDGNVPYGTGSAALKATNANSSGGTALFGHATATSGATAGVFGVSNSPAGAGVWGKNGSFVGVLGESSSSNGVAGISATGPGVYGQSSSNTGVSGKSTTGAGVVGESGPWVGVYGVSTSFTGVWGKSATGVGVAGESTTWAGVYGVSIDNAGVWGKSTNGFAGYFEGTVGITGGSDLAELFDVSGAQAEPGALLIIDASKPGQLTISTHAYDTKVAGIVSGAGGVNPGLTLHQEGVMEGDTHVAIAGRVYVKATAINGAIEPGDLLTTSDVPGHTMKATDADRSHGAIIGKAMTGLDSGTGLVLVLVNLQ